jgi:hypothetical protein
MQSKQLFKEKVKKYIFQLNFNEDDLNYVSFLAFPYKLWKLERRKEIAGGRTSFFSKHNLFQVFKFKYKYPTLPPTPLAPFPPLLVAIQDAARCLFPDPTPVESYFTTVLLAK